MYNVQSETNEDDEEDEDEDLDDIIIQNLSPQFREVQNDEIPQTPKLIHSPGRQSSVIGNNIEPDLTPIRSPPYKKNRGYRSDDTGRDQQSPELTQAGYQEYPHSVALRVDDEEQDEEEQDEEEQEQNDNNDDDDDAQQYGDDGVYGNQPNETALHTDNEMDDYDDDDSVTSENVQNDDEYGNDSQFEADDEEEEDQQYDVRESRICINKTASIGPLQEQDENESYSSDDSDSKSTTTPGYNKEVQHPQQVDLESDSSESDTSQQETNTAPISTDKINTKTRDYEGFYNQAMIEQMHLWQDEEMEAAELIWELSWMRQYKCDLTRMLILNGIKSIGWICPTCVANPYVHNMLKLVKWSPSTGALFPSGVDSCFPDLTNINDILTQNQKPSRTAIVDTWLKKAKKRKSNTSKTTNTSNTANTLNIANTSNTTKIRNTTKRSKSSKQSNPSSHPFIPSIPSQTNRTKISNSNRLKKKLNTTLQSTLHTLDTFSHTIRSKKKKSKHKHKPRKLSGGHTKSKKFDSN